MDTIDALYLIKWVVLGLVGLSALLIGCAAWLDVRERRRWRAMIPDAWPPTGELQDEKRKQGVKS